MRCARGSSQNEAVAIPPPQTISEVARRDILDFLSAERVAWAGRLDEADFLSRVWDLSRIRSDDRRFQDVAGDIHQHRVNNPEDWEQDWVFWDERFNLLRCPDGRFGAFLSQIVHPTVRADVDEARRLVNAFNERLAHDDWELIESGQLSGRPVFAARRREEFRTALEALDVAKYERVEDPQALREHLRRIERDLRSDPPGAIGSSKELVETVCKTILNDYKVEYRDSAEVLDLYKAVQKALLLNVEAVKGSKKGSGSSVKTLRALVTTIQSLAELRNELGLGHGRRSPSPALTRHALLAFNASVAVCEFLLATWHARRSEGR